MIRTHLMRLRRKLGVDGDNPRYILAESRVGYRGASGPMPGQEPKLSRRPLGAAGDGPAQTKRPCGHGKGSAIHSPSGTGRMADYAAIVNPNVSTRLRGVHREPT